jgi:hypothetical protein
MADLLAAADELTDPRVEETTEHRCITCPRLRPTHPPRRPNAMPVCDGCRDRVHRELKELTDAYAAIALEPGRHGTERMSTAFGPRLPAALGALNLLGPGSLDAPYTVDDRGVPDQVGELPALYLLDQWVIDWRHTRDMHEHMPDPTMSAITRWLLDRLDWAFTHHAAVDDFAHDLSRITIAVRAITQTSQYRGEDAGKCPALTRDETPCGTQLRVDPYTDVIACHRCGTSWHRRKGDWLRLRGAQVEQAKVTA